MWVPQDDFSLEFVPAAPLGEYPFWLQGLQFLQEAAPHSGAGLKGSSFITLALLGSPKEAEFLVEMEIFPLRQVCHHVGSSLEWHFRNKIAYIGQQKGNNLGSSGQNGKAQMTCMSMLTVLSASDPQQSGFSHSFPCPAMGNRVPVLCHDSRSSLF